MTFHIRIANVRVESCYGHTEASRAFWSIAAHEKKNGRDPKEVTFHNETGHVEPRPYQECNLQSWAMDVLDDHKEDTNG